MTSLAELVGSAERFQPNPFSKRLVHSRLSRTLEGGKRGWKLRQVLVGVGALLLAASAAAAGFGLLDAPPRVPPESRADIAPRAPSVLRAPTAGISSAVEASEPAVASPPAVERPVGTETKKPDKPRAGEDPSQVTEAVRALRKQGDPLRAQLLLDQYLSANPRGALAEDALALAIEAAAARKDPRAADYARRYLARFPNGRFRGVAERALAR